ncbi:MAG TPA: 2-hydroxychromene-2-carboxylate isomerase [Polyangiaceae bacterium]|jgi:2-hydroxychromene-2-carboxylate isomerase|nr:2-hydroxychromene-2-carboxylate isomerase [Polyangiaceae bacterium]
MTPSLEFWFDFASTYSFLSAMRIDALATAAGVALEYKPFILGPIFGAQGWQTSPFNIYEAKGRYMWRDMERVTQAAGLSFRRPSVFPRNSLLAARVALVCERESWSDAFVRAVYEANFVNDRDISDRAVVGEILTGLGADSEAVLDLAGTSATKERLRGRTNDAVNLGIFGAPSFVARGELFWGNDRLEDALRWATRLH